MRTTSELTSRRRYLLPRSSRAGFLTSPSQPTSRALSKLINAGCSIISTAIPIIFANLHDIVAMSGIEVAGLVLGAFPLLIKSLEYHREMADAAGVFWKIKREYRKWAHDLEMCNLAFSGNLQSLLLPLVADDDAIKELLADPGGKSRVRSCGSNTPRF